MMLDIVSRAVEKYGHETVSLKWLPESRYDFKAFPTSGQYDWFDGQLLYCLIRLLRPRGIVEISMSSGYSTAFMATALRANGHGCVHTFELDRRCVRSASRNFEQWGLSEFVRIHEGDAKVTSLALTDLSDFSILFLDSLHTEGFARWFIERFVLKAAPDVLFHVHDVLPPGTSKYSAPVSYTKGRLRLRWLLQDPARVLRRHWRDREPQDWSEEAFVHRLAEQMSPDDYAYLHDIADKFPQLSPRAYDHLAIGRVDATGRPQEYNQSFWCMAGAVQRAYPLLVQ